MKKVLGLFSCIVFMSSCVTYSVVRNPYDSDQSFNEIIDSKSIILISDSVVSDPIDEVIISKGHPKLIKDFKIENGIISGVIVEIPEHIYVESKGDINAYIKKENPDFNKYFREGRALKVNFAKRKLREAKEVVYLSTQKKLGYGPFTMRLSDFENGTERTAATYEVNYPITVVKNFGALGPAAIVFISVAIAAASAPIGF